MRNSQATKEPRARFRLLFNTVSRLNVLKLRRSIYLCSRGKHLLYRSDILARLQCKITASVRGSDLMERLGCISGFFVYNFIEIYESRTPRMTLINDNNTETQPAFESQKDGQRHFALISFMPWLSYASDFCIAFAVYNSAKDAVLIFWLLWRSHKARGHCGTVLLLSLCLNIYLGITV